MNEVRSDAGMRWNQPFDADNRNVDNLRNLLLLKDYQAYLRVEKGLRPLTCEAYSSDLNTFAEFMEGRNSVLSSAIQADVSAFLGHLRNHGIDSRSAARKLSCLRGFYKWLLLDRRIHHDPTVNIESPKAWKVLPKSLAEPEVKEMLERSREHGVDLRVVPDMYDGLVWDSPIEYIGQFPTIPLHRGHVPEIALLLKRVVDIMLSGLILTAISPLLLTIAVAVKLDSKGPVFYLSNRLGKKGRVFGCIKFRTMVIDADKRRAEIMHMNERDSVLFKITNDPRITKLGRFLRKYSFDELPQFFNVLLGDMSIVGPRPPLASEVQKYKLSHLRRLDVTPGITGLWQVQSRQDPSFDSYISLDVTYIENWSVWLDIKIILRTIGVVLAGTGS